MSEHIITRAAPAATTDRWGRAACLAGAALVVAAFVLAGGLVGIQGTDGRTVTDDVVAKASGLQAGAFTAVLAGAALLVAAARLGDVIPATSGRVAAASGAAVAVLMTAYYASFGSGAVVGTLLMEQPSGAVGEGTLLMLNLVELTRFAPTFALLAAAVVARRHLPRPVVVAAAVLALMMLAPFTAWLAALLAPLWLGIAGASVPGRGA